MLRDLAPEARHKVPMWIDHAKATPCINVLERHRLDERGLACSGSTKQVHVREAVAVLDAELAIVGASVRTSEIENGVHLNTVSRGVAQSESRRCRPL